MRAYLNKKQMKEILRSYLAEINFGSTIPGNGSTVQFQYFPQLENVVIYGIEAIKANVMALSPTAQALVTTLTGLSVTIVNKNQKNIIEGYPCYDLDPSTTGGLYRNFKPFELNLVKSFVTIMDASTLIANQSVCFNVFYATMDEVKQLAAQNAKQPIRRK